MLYSFKTIKKTPEPIHHPRHPKCAGYRDDWTLEFDCGYRTTLLCEECKYGCGRKDPEAKCNQSG